MSPGSRNSRIYALQNMLSATSTSSTLVSVESQLSEAEERERAFDGSGRWDQIRSLPGAKTVLNFLFSIASSARCSLWDKEVDCREKDCEIRDLKEKVVHLIGQLEMQQAGFIHEEKLWKSTMKKESNSGKSIQSSDELHAYDLPMKVSQESILYNGGENFVGLLEDINTFQSEHSSHEADDGIDWEYSDIDWEYSGWRHAEAKRRKHKTNKKLSKPKRHSVALSNSSYSDDKETMDAMPAVEQDTILKKMSDVCCSCSKHPFCKTAKCECRVAGGNCGVSCGCNPKKCSNREVSIKNLGALPPLELLEDTRNVSSADTEIRNDTAAKRKPLSNIGNTKPQVKSDAPRLQQRKRWREPAFFSSRVS